MSHPKLLVLPIAFLLLLAACTPQPTGDRSTGGIISISPFTSGPDTMMVFTTGPDTMGAVPETLWITKVDCTLTIKYTALPAGPDTMMVGRQFRVVARHLMPKPPIKR